MVARFRAWLRPIGWIVGIAVFIAVARSLAIDTSRVWETLSRVDLVMVGVAIACLMSAHVLGAAEWWLLMRGLGSRLPFLDAIVVHCTATLVKYLPGFGWHIVGKIELAGRRGVPRPLVAASLAIEFAAIIGGGAVLVMILAPLVPAGRAAALPTGIVAVIALLGIFAAVLTLWRASLRITVVQEGTVRPAYVVAATFAMAATWTIVGSGTFAIARSVVPIGPESWPIAVSATAIGFIGGLLAVFAPTGIGVRESLIVFGLASILDETAAVAVAVLLRIALMLSEIVIYLVVVVVGTVVRRVNVVDQNGNAIASKRRERRI